MQFPATDVPPGLPPWMLPTPVLSFTPTTKADHLHLQLQLALEHVATVTSSVTQPHRIYTDGSLQSDGSAGCSVFSPDLEPPVGGWIVVDSKIILVRHIVNSMLFWMQLILFIEKG